MLPYVFGFILLLHGIIHLMGFAKAFNLADIADLQLPVSRFWGALWLVATLLFLASLVLYGLSDNRWWQLALIAVIVSQVLILAFWADAKYGTIANMIVLIGIGLAWGQSQFNNTLQAEYAVFLTQQPRQVEQVLREGEITDLPACVQRWMHRSGSINKPRIQSVHLRQEGRMRTDPDGRWMPFEAQQFIGTGAPGFIWAVEVKAAPLVHLSGRDHYIDGKGAMRIELLSLFPIVDAQGPEINQGAQLRWLSELLWCPSAAVAPAITWDSLSTHTARATLEIEGLETSGVFTFNEQGDPLRFEAMRYFTQNEESSLEKWIINIDPEGFREFNGIRIPARSRVSWDLEKGTFEWLEMNITDLLINRPRPNFKE